MNFSKNDGKPVLCTCVIFMCMQPSIYRSLYIVGMRNHKQQTWAPHWTLFGSFLRKHSHHEPHQILCCSEIGKSPVSLSRLIISNMPQLKFARILSWEFWDKQFLWNRLLCQLKIKVTLIWELKLNTIHIKLEVNWVTFGQDGIVQNLSNVNKQEFCELKKIN